MTVGHKPDTEYAWVELGPIPRMRDPQGGWFPTPSWHQQAHPSRYPFPTDAAATLFATNNKADWPERQVAVLRLDGSRKQIENV